MKPKTKKARGVGKIAAAAPDKPSDLESTKIRGGKKLPGKRKPPTLTL